MFSATRLSATKAGADAAQTAAERDAACKAAARQRRIDAEAAARAHREEERRRAAREPPPAFVAKYEARIAANRCMAARLDASRRELHVAGRALKDDQDAALSAVLRSIRATAAAMGSA